MMKKRLSQAIALCVSALLLAACLALPALAEAPVRVAVIDYPNYLQQESDGTVGGYAYEYLYDLQRMTGWKYQFIEMSFAEATEALTKGEIDLLPGNQYSDERAQLWDFSARDMGEGGTVLCVLPGDTRYSFNDF
ncbi:MAG: transporter substrate-binding domain-containing protein, partial [Eubacteriales bacterium]|nr:transporter substrate-binding domain-containing protein [Eubacteriales bacterium]